MTENASQPDDDQKPADPYEVEDARIEKLVAGHVAALAEHCESVRIVVTVNRGDGVYARFSQGDGNYFAQYGSVKDWLIAQEQQTRDASGE